MENNELLNEISEVAVDKLYFWNRRKPSNRPTSTSALAHNRISIKSAFMNCLMDKTWDVADSPRNLNTIHVQKDGPVLTYKLVTKSAAYKNYLVDSNIKEVDRLYFYDNEYNVFYGLDWDTFSMFVKNHARAVSFNTNSVMWVVPLSWLRLYSDSVIKR